MAVPRHSHSGLSVTVQRKIKLCSKKLWDFALTWKFTGYDDTLLHLENNLMYKANEKIELLSEYQYYCRDVFR